MDLRAVLQSALGRNVTLERELGGGMSRVFVAVDATLARRIVIKVLPTERISGASLERFRREILVTAGLQHPHIVPVLDAGDVDGIPYYTMPFIEGESLRDRLRRDQRVPWREALEIACQVAKTLDYAHGAGVVHRDVKPENILLSRGHALVTDFGVARAFAPSALTSVTDVGLVVGTPTYMSPEQFTGGRDVDGRSDLYSLGCVLFELLAGAPPFEGPTLQATIARRFVDPVPSVRDLQPEVPRWIDGLLQHALARDRVDRIPTGAAFAALGALCGASAQGELQERERSIAVLPFASLSPDPADEVFADGLTDEIVTDLSRVQTLRVTSRNSTLRYKGSTKDVRTIGGELRVRYLLEGSVRCDGTLLRVIARVIDANLDSQVWAERYTGTRADVFDIQEQIARRIAAALKVTLTQNEERRLALRPIQDIHAFELYVRARQLSVRFTPTALNEAMALVERAIALEGRCAPLLALKGSIYWNMHNTGARGNDVLPLAAENVDQALGLDPELAAALVARALLSLRDEIVDMSHVLRLLRAACEAERSPDAYMWMALYLSQTGRPELAVPYARMASVLDPLTPIVGGIAALPYMFMGLTEEGLRLATYALERDPGDEVTRFLVGVLTSVAGRFGEASAHFDQPDPGGVWGHLSRLHRVALAGDRTDAMELAADPHFSQVIQHDEQFCWLVARVLAYAGERDAAIRKLRQAAVRGFVNARFVGEVDAMLAGLRDHPEFSDLLAFMQRRAMEIAKASEF